LNKEVHKRVKPYRQKYRKRHKYKTSSKKIELKYNILKMMHSHNLAVHYCHCCSSLAHVNSPMLWWQIGLDSDHTGPGLEACRPLANLQTVLTAGVM